MAWAETLPSGRYRAGYRIPGGEKRYLDGTFTHKAEAERLAGQAEAESRKLGWRDPRSAERTWGEWCEEWMRGRYVEKSTMRRDESRINSRIRPKWGDTPLVDITRHEVKAWAVELKNDGLAPQSVKRAIALFATSLSAAVDAEVLAANPAARLKLNIPVNLNERVLSRKEQRKLFAALETDQDRALVAVLLGTGARWGEAVALAAGHFKIKRGTVRFRRAWDAQNGERIEYTKGKKRRSVPLAPWLIEIIKPVLRSAPEGYLFATDAGTPVDYSNWHKRSWTPALLSAGIGENTDGKATIHTLRHTYATEQLDAGLSISEIADLLGHASMSTTERYAHRRSKVRAEAATAVSDPRSKPKKQAKPRRAEALPGNVIAFPTAG